MLSTRKSDPTLHSERIRVRGVVQGVGFRPYVWRLAREAGLAGSVCNDGAGVVIEVFGSVAQIENLVSGLRRESPPLASISSIERLLFEPDVIPEGFFIAASQPTQPNTVLPADAAMCADCGEDIVTPGNRRFGYAFTNCTHCGPRLSIIEGIPYDRANTTMRAFALCATCAAEYADPADRRFHAQPNACPDCGPQLWLEAEGDRIAVGNDALLEAALRIKQGEVVAIKGIGGIHLAVDATDRQALAKLRQRKQRPAKPLALMARDVAQVRRWCRVAPEDEAVLGATAAPVVLLPRIDGASSARCLIAPRQGQLGFMLPYSPLHHLLMAALDDPILLTSANRYSEPQFIDNDEARMRLADIADALLLHDRDIANRIDDSVVRRMGGELRILRRARGYAPEPVPLADDFSGAPDLLAMGGELKNTFCLLQRGKAVLSQHMGDLENYTTHEDYRKNLELYARLYQHEPAAIAVDGHPDYLSTRLGREYAAEHGIPLLEVQHHHAHVAACLAENAEPMDVPPVLGIVLDGLGYGDDGTLWGGEFLLADYCASRRLASLRPAPLPGGVKAMQEPWRNLWAQLQTSGLASKSTAERLRSKPVATLRQMLAQGINSPMASSAGRLFDAVAAAVGICVDRITYEGQAAIELEALLDGSENPVAPYPFATVEAAGRLLVDPAPMWRALLADLEKGVEPAVISHRFHYGLGDAMVAMALRLTRQYGISRVVLSGGVFQNHALFERVMAGLRDEVVVLTHRRVPMNDGGLALGQLAVAAARMVRC
jgi:hydrogenase maturation protein HypF